MNFSLDIIWFDENQKIVEIVLFAEQEGAVPQKIYQPGRPAKYVLEVAAGFVEKHNLQNGNEFVFLSE